LNILPRHRRRHGRLYLGDDAVAEYRGDDRDGVEHAEHTVLGVAVDRVVLRGRSVRVSCNVATYHPLFSHDDDDADLGIELSTVNGIAG
jgi:hypothetical protein